MARSPRSKEIDFTSTSADAYEVTPPVSETSTGVTMEQVKNLFAERDVRLVDLITEKMMVLAGKQPVIDDTLPVSTIESTIGNFTGESTAVWNADELFQ